MMQSDIRPFSTTSFLCAEPLRKRHRIDPALLKLRVEKKIAKTQREIARIESEPKQLIPILEYQPTSSELRDLTSRPGRTFEDVGLDASKLKAAQKLWSVYRAKQARRQSRCIKRMETAQNRALETLKELDKDLYNRTIAVDDLSLIPYRNDHVRRETPPIPNYQPPDGYIKDISKEWKM